MTFSDLQVLTSDWLDDPNNGYFTLSVLKQRLNLSLRELQKRLISANNEYYAYCVKTDTIRDQAAYALPTDFLQILRLDYVVQGSGTTAVTQKICSMTPNQRDLLTSTSGDPLYYYFQKNNLILAPVPNRVVTMHLEYSYYVADMTNQSDTPDAPAQFHEYIAALTTRDCLIKDGRPLGPIQKKLDDYETLLKQIAVQREADGTRMVTVTGDIDW